MCDAYAVCGSASTDLLLAFCFSCICSVPAKCEANPSSQKMLQHQHVWYNTYSPPADCSWNDWKDANDSVRGLLMQVAQKQW